MRIYRYFVAAALLLACESADAFVIKSFTEDALDVSASLNSRLTDGHKAALVKVNLPIKNMQFMGNVVGDVAHVDGEYWVYLDPESTSLTIIDEDGNETNVNFSQYGVGSVVSGATYKIDCTLSAREQKALYGDSAPKPQRTEFVKPQHLSKSFTYRGEQYYMTQEEWRQQPYEWYFAIEPEGIVVGFGNKYSVWRGDEKDANYDLVQLTWEEAKEYVKQRGLRLPTKAEAEFYMKIYEQFDKSTEAGLKGGPPYFPGRSESWLEEEFDTNQAWYFSPYLDYIGELDKNQKRSFITIRDIDNAFYAGTADDTSADFVASDGKIFDFEQLFLKNPLIKYEVRNNQLWNLTTEMAEALDLKPATMSEHQNRIHYQYNIYSGIRSNPPFLLGTESYPSVVLIGLTFKDNKLEKAQYYTELPYDKKVAKEQKKRIMENFKWFARRNGFEKTSQKEALKLLGSCSSNYDYYINPSKREFISVYEDQFFIYERY